MASCETCKSWLVQRVTDYEDGSRIVNFQAPENRGRCEALAMETEARFFCAKWEEGYEHVEVMAKKAGAPWQHSHWGSCPDCEGTAMAGGALCRRCAGSGKVLHYDDGYVGEEQTRLHPMEKAKGPPPPPVCMNCNRQIELTWVACPFCGARTNASEEPMRVSEALITGG